jgi:hypothetical protein
MVFMCVLIKGLGVVFADGARFAAAPRHFKESFELVELPLRVASMGSCLGKSPLLPGL